MTLGAVQRAYCPSCLSRQDSSAPQTLARTALLRCISCEIRCNRGGTGPTWTCWFSDFTAYFGIKSRFLHQEDINDGLEISPKRP